MNGEPIRKALESPVVFVALACMLAFGLWFLQNLYEQQRRIEIQVDRLIEKQSRFNALQEQVIDRLTKVEAKVHRHNRTNNFPEDWIDE